MGGLVDDILRYAGSSIRGGDLFQNKSFFAQARSTVTRSIKGVENVYTQHKSQTHHVVDHLIKGKLKESSYPFVDGARYSPPNNSQGRTKAVVFVVGGTTFEEAREVAEINRTLEGGRSVVLGGTTIHNSRSFLIDLTQLS